MYPSGRQRCETLPRVTVSVNNNQEAREIVSSTLSSKSKTSGVHTTPKKVSAFSRIGCSASEKKPSAFKKLTLDFGSNRTATTKGSTNLFQTPLMRRSKPLLDSENNSNFTQDATYNVDKIEKSHSKPLAERNGNTRSSSKPRFADPNNIALNLNLALNIDQNHDSENSDDYKTGSSDFDEMKVPCHKSSVQVAVRMRPYLKNEAENSKGFEVKIKDKKVLVKRENKSTNDLFEFDYAWDSSDYEKIDFVSQEKVFLNVGQSILDYALEGYNTCLFAYGQSGSGKTYTMMGTKSNPGIIPRLLRELFRSIDRKSGVTFDITVNFIEIYQEKIYDLLADEFATNKSLRVRECPTLGPHVPDLTNYTVEDYEYAFDLMQNGNRKRSKASTALNDSSSRSHAVFTILIVQKSSDEPEMNLVSKINLVDLAGSERPGENEKDRFREGAIINKSLFTLGKVITALSEGEKVVPYRESVLTFLLKDSLGGNSRTFMVAAISPAREHMEETISTLRYASTASKIVNIVHVNEDPTTTYINALIRQISVLKKQVNSSKYNDVSTETDDEYFSQYNTHKTTFEDSSAWASDSTREDEDLRDKLFNLSTQIDHLFLNQTGISQAFDELKNAVVKSFDIEVPSFETNTVNLLKDLLHEINSDNVVSDSCDVDELLKKYDVKKFDFSSDDEDFKTPPKVKKFSKSGETIPKRIIDSSDSETEENPSNKAETLKKKSPQSRKTNEVQKKPSESPKKEAKKDIKAEESDDEPPASMTKSQKKKWRQDREQRKIKETEDSKKEEESKDDKADESDDEPPAGLSKNQKKKWRQEREERKAKEAEEKTKKEVEKDDGKVEVSDDEPPAGLNKNQKKKWRQEREERKTKEAEEKAEKEAGNSTKEEESKVDKAEESDDEPPANMTKTQKKKWRQEREERKALEAEEKAEQKAEEDKEKVEQSDDEPPANMTKTQKKKWRQEREERKALEAEEKAEKKAEEDKEKIEESDDEPPANMTKTQKKKWRQEREERKALEAEEKAEQKAEEDKENVEQSDDEPPAGLTKSQKKKWYQDRDERKEAKEKAEKEAEHSKEEQSKDDKAEESDDEPPANMTKTQKKKWRQEREERKALEAEEKAEKEADKDDENAEESDGEPPAGLTKSQKKKWYQDRDERKAQEAKENAKKDSPAAKKFEKAEESDSEPPSHLSGKKRKQWIKDREARKAREALNTSETATDYQDAESDGDRNSEAEDFPALSDKKEEPKKESTDNVWSSPKSKKGKKKKR